MELNVGRRTLTALFAAAASRHADRTAVVCGDAAIDYVSLERMASCFAASLLRFGVRPGQRVAILQGRSISTLIAIVGILKAGAAYVPLDPDEPSERLRGMLVDCAPAAVICESRSKALIAGLGLAIVDAPHQSQVALEPHNTDVAVEPGDAAYIMYTSGSTGKPKGVIVPHRAVARLVTGQIYTSFDRDETWLHLAPLTFDASTLEIWGALLNGSRLAIVPNAQPSLDDIAGAIARHNVTTAWFTAGLFSLIVDHRLEALRTLRHILAGGDVLSPAHVQRAYSGLPKCTIVNGYGPTENTTFTCCFTVPREGWGDGSIPIGVPVRGTDVQILDADLRPVVPGNIGQICCSGEGLAIGYLNRPVLTETAFVDVVFHDGSSRKVYLTGDLGRERPDGRFEFCGRTDSQVKINGKRVELGDVEHALRCDPEIENAIVTALTTASGNQQIVAYLRPKTKWDNQHHSSRTAKVLAGLRNKLPGFMIPTMAIVVSEFPLTTNGKIDQAKLPSPTKVNPRRGRHASSSRTEDMIEAIWKEVLGTSDIGRETNFFDLGGNSILLMGVHERLRTSISPGLSLLKLFECTTVRSIATVIDRDMLDAASRSHGANSAPAFDAPSTDGSLS